MIFDKFANSIALANSNYFEHVEGDAINKQSRKGLI